MDIDVSVTDEDGHRMRVNVYHQRNNVACCIIIIDSNIPTLEQPGMPPIVKTFTELKSGLVLITIEDPIEYVYPFDKAMIHQRQVGKDVDSFATALRSSLHEDPDIILVGEMRDYETINAAITAAEPVLVAVNPNRKYFQGRGTEAL